MSLSKILPQKHVVIICYIFVALIIGLSSLFALLSIIKSQWFITGLTLVLGLFVWFIKGGKLKFGGNQGLGLEDADIVKEGEDLPKREEPEREEPNDS